MSETGLKKRRVNINNASIKPNENPYLAHLSQSYDQQSQSQRIDTPTATAINPHTGQIYSARYYEILKKRQELPVYKQRQDFANLLRSNQMMILVGETGSGKTTQ